MGAKNWWKYSLCIFGALGIGYAVGVRTTKTKAEKEMEDKIADIREIYRNDRKASRPKTKPTEQKPDADTPDVHTKTSIDIEKLSKRKERAQDAENHYNKTFREDDKPGTEESETEDISEEKDSEDDLLGDKWMDYIRVVDEFPEECSDWRDEVLIYYADGVVANAVTGKKQTDEELLHMVGGNEVLRRLDEDGCFKLYVINDLYQIKYTIIFEYKEWAQVEEEEPYKAEL